MKGKTIDLFPGGNTSNGFHSFYRYILTQEEARRIICIKGGPGTGKSSLMKKVAAHFNNKGYDIEYHHCSSDNISLDGIVIKGLNVAILDGTAPHVVDPINPGAVDEVLNMGECWIEEGFKKYRDNIIDINKEVSRTFKRAYRFFAAARAVHEDWCSYNKEALNHVKLNQLKEELKQKIFKEEVINNGKERHLFITALTPNGIVTFVDTILKDYQNVYVLSGGPGTGKSEVLDYLTKEAIKRGYYTQIFHDPFIVDRIEHVFIEELNVAIVSSNEINNKKFMGYQIDMNSLLNSNIIKNQDEINKDKDLFYQLLNKGLSTITTAKSLHDKLETYYVPNMDFSKAEEKCQMIIDKIEKYEQELK